jgi:DNA mismatch endonuclease, patch repair protein
LLTMDSISKKRRSWNMSRIRSKDTKPELIVRSFLHRKGYRFRLHKKDLPGIPDIVLPKFKIAVLVHGCFWHRHSGCKYAYSPKSNVAKWNKKFEDNVKRDEKVNKDLKSLGWNTITIWECEVLSGEYEYILTSELKR